MNVHKINSLYINKTFSMTDIEYVILNGYLINELKIPLKSGEWMQILLQ